MKKQILIVDDDEEFCEEMSEILQDEGYRVGTVFDGLKVNKLLKENKYDLVFLDIKMPGISGFELLKRIRQDKITTKIVVITGGLIGEKLPKKQSANNKEDDDAALKLADAVVTKPFDIKLVLDKVSELLSKYK